MNIKKNILYAQSGGVTSVINASAAGLIETARNYPDKIGNIYAGYNGILGVLCEELVVVSEESVSAIAGLRHTPSAAFGSCRLKLQDIEQNDAQYERLLTVFKTYNIGYFFYNGGGDSADTCYKISQFAKRAGFDLQVIHIPKTIDNDLPITDNSPGFGSVAKYVAISMREASYDVASMAKTSTKVFVLEVMGRHAGWIAAAGGLATDKQNPIPIIILFPEIVFDQERFLAKVKANVQKYGYCSVVVSEGVKWPSGEFLSAQGLRDSFGHAQLGGAAPVVANVIKQALGYKYHWAIADYLQRSARHIAAKVDVQQAYALGQAAIEMALAGENAIMLTIKRISNTPYQWEFGTAKLEDVANIEKMLPAEFISADGFGITELCRSYLMPLIEGEDYPPYVCGMPDYVRLKNILVDKKLAIYKA